MEALEHLVLYRKYRPSSFSEVVGQDHIVSVLKNALTQGHVAHAYLFSGTRGTGKTTLARLLAKAYNCEKLKDDGEPCNTCATCKEFSSGKAIDLIEIDAASARGIDDIRELRESVRYTPMRAKRKVYIIDEVHMLTKEAWAALLKTLEEPPQHAMFVLATTELDRVPDTILSRTQSFEFRRVGQAKLIERLSILIKKEKYKLDKDALMLVAFLADGSIRDSESLLGQLMDAFPESASKENAESLFGLPKMKLVHLLLASALTKNPVEIVEAFKMLGEQGIEPKILGRLLINEARTLLVSLIDPKEIKRLETMLSEEHLAFFARHKEVPRVDVERMLVKLLEAYGLGFRGPFAELPFELALLEVSTPTPEKTAFQKPAFLS